MTILIVVAIFASLLGSILWVMPSKRDQERMKMRLLARKSQLGVQLTYIELPDRWDKSTTKVKATAYHKFRAKKLKNLVSDVCLYPFEVWKYESLEGNWYVNAPIELSESSRAILTNNLDNFKAIVITIDSVSVYWEERGGESSVDDIKSLLEELEAIDFD
jgi:hypothetical protein